MNLGIAGPTWTYLRRHWLNLRCKRYWLVVLVLLYTLAGFFGVPWLLERTATDAMATDFDRELRIEDVRFNPYTFRLEIDGLALDDIDGASIAAFDRFVIDFTLASVTNRAWTFELIHLDGLRLQEERFQSGETRLVRLIEAFTSAPEQTDTVAADDTEAAQSAPPPVLVEELRLSAARADFTDHVPEETVELGVDPLSIQVRNLDTRPEHSGSQSIRMVLESGGTLNWTGELQLTPLRSTGQIKLADVALGRALPYIREFLPIHDLGLVLGADLDYAVGMTEGGVELQVSGMEATLRDLSLTAFDPRTEFLSASAIRIGGASYEHAKRRVEIGSLDIDVPKVRTWRAENGEIGLLTLLADADPAGPEPSDTEATDGAAEAEPGVTADPAATGEAGGMPIEFVLREFRINGLEADFADRTVEPTASFGLRNTDFGIDGFELAPGSRFDTRLQGELASGGTLSFEGKAQILPGFDLDGRLQVDALELAVTEPYLRDFARVRLAGGSVSLGGDIGTRPSEPFTYDGAVSVDGLDVRTSSGDQEVIGWRRLHVERLQLGLGAGRARTSVIELDRPFARVAIAEDRSTNIGQLLVDQSPTDEPGQPASDKSTGEAGAETGEAPTEADSKPFAFTIGGIAIDQGELAFSDRSLPLPFMTRVHGMSGRVSTIASNTSEPAAVELEGQVEENGLARIDGSFSTWNPTRNTDMRLEFRNLEMPDYSPYTAQFAGRRIARGRMDLDLAYRLDAGQLRATNDLVLHDLQLGDKVESPDALDLPLGLAVALLKDSDGVIDIAVPVNGDVDDPQFEIGGAIRNALGDLIGKIVSSPFRFLASLVGLESGELGQIEFLAGRSDLTPPQRETVGKLAEALAQRPQLVLEVVGTFSPALDRPVLQRRMARDALHERLRQVGTDTEGVTLTDEAAHEAVETLFVEAYPESALGDVRERFVRVPEGLSEEEAESAEPEFDEVAYRSHLAQRLIDAQEVGPAALAALAQERAGTVRSYLVDGETGARLDAARVQIGEPRETEVESGDRVPIEVSLQSG